MKGKQTCKILKEIRKQIAEENDIEFVTSECTYQGECKGTCPKCEAEVRYLEHELEKRQRMGKVAVISGMAIGTMFGATSCLDQVRPLEGDVMYVPDSSEIEALEQPLPGEIADTSCFSVGQQCAEEPLEGDVHPIEK